MKSPVERPGFLFVGRLHPFVIASAAKHIQSNISFLAGAKMDCFASLAMTVRLLRWSLRSRNMTVTPTRYVRLAELEIDPAQLEAFKSA